MKFIKNVLYLEFNDLVECGVSSEYLRSARSRGIKSINFIDDPADRRRVLIEYEPLTTRYKQLVIARFGNPYEYICREPIRRLIIKDLAAEAYYLQYRFENGSSLPADYIEKYTRCCDYLNMLLKVEKDKSIAKKLLNISLASFYSNVSEIFKAENIGLPKNYQKLRARMSEYAKDGYDCLIEKWRFNNTHAAKVNDELSQSFLLELISHDSKLDDVQIMSRYNLFAKENGYKPITDATVGNWRRDNEANISVYRDGNKAWYNKFGKHTLRKRASAPLLLIGGDGNDWDMYFQGPKGKVQTYYFNLFTLVVVIDTYNNYPLGWSISEPNGSETAALIKAAYVDALQHIKDLTGNYYLPHQLQADRFAETQMLPFFQKIDPNFFFAAARAPRGKYIESSFGTVWHKILRENFNNYSGHNITAKSKITPERIDREKKDFPHIKDAFAYAEHFITLLRTLVDDEATGLTRQEQWMKAFTEHSKSRERLITDEQFIYNFGTTNPRQQTITNRGLEVQINNNIYLYEIPNEYYLQTVGKTVQIIYDPYDFDRVIVTDGNKLRFLATTAQYLPSAKADYTEGDDARFFKRLHEKKKIMEGIAAEKAKRKNILAQNGVEAKAYLQSGGLDKLLKRNAELSYHGQQQITLPDSADNADFDDIEEM